MKHDLSRRDALAATAAGVAALALTPRRAAAAPAADVLDLRVISHTPHAYCGWPTLTRRVNGELLVVYSGSRVAHVCPYGRLEMIRSRDGGETWTHARVLLDSVIDDRDGGVLETSKGALLATSFTSLAYEPQLAKHPEWRAVHERVDDATRKAELGQWMVRSDDGGLTWSARYPTIVNSPHGPIELSDGRLLYAGKELWTGERRVGVCESTDDGRTWKWLAQIPTRDGDDPAQYHELHAVEATDGRVIVQIRNHNKVDSRETLQCESDDGGRTWTTPHAIGVWGLPSHLLRLRDGRLLMSYGHRRPPFGNQARLSADHGRSWSEPIAISADGAGGDLGYPSTVELADGALITVWYEKLRDRPMAALRQALWTLRA